MKSASASILRAEQVRRRYGGVWALRDISLTVEAGERVGIIGPNGAGKTTLFNVLSGRVQPSDGQIWLDDRNVTGKTESWLCRKGLGRTFQHNSLFAGLTVFENVRLAVQLSIGRSFDLFRSADSDSAVIERTQNLLAAVHLEACAAAPINSLSYGVQRQIEIAVALAADPRLLLLDEPTAGMSPAETSSMVSLIRSLPRSITLLMVEHDMDAVFAIADRLVVLNQGQVVADGAPDAVRADRRVLDVYLTGGGHVQH